MVFIAELNDFEKKAIPGGNAAPHFPRLHSLVQSPHIDRRGS
jgi:hypothetical protein